jgi:GT2 family glycosyltransferase
MNRPLVLVIVLNWRHGQMTIECVRTVAEMDYPNLRVLLVDNGSADGSQETLRAALPQVDMLALPKNLGFAGGANAGLRWAAARGYQYALLLNNDAFPAADMLTCLMDETCSDIALLSPKIYYESQRECIWFAGGRQESRLLEMRETGQDQPDGPYWSVSRDVDYLVGTCLLVNLESVAKVGLLDEQFFMYYEDLDWSIRLRQAGYRLRLVAAAHVYHRVSQSTGGIDTPLHRYYLARSSLLFFSRYRHLGSPGAIMLYRSLSALKTIIRLLLAGRTGSALGYVRGLADGWAARQGTDTKSNLQL